MLVLLDEFDFLFFVKDFLFGVLGFEAVVSFGLEVVVVLEVIEVLPEVILNLGGFIFDQFDFFVKLISLLLEFVFMLLDKGVDTLFIFFFFLDNFLFQFLLFKLMIILELHHRLFGFCATSLLVVFLFFLVIF